MSDPKIAGGYIMAARKTLESEIMDKPPLYMKLWMWMLMRANYKDTCKLKRGQLLASIKDMQDACSHYVGYRKKTPTRREIRSAYEHFAKSTMISTAKSTRGMVITICNYDLYQNRKSYEGHNEGATKGEVATQDSKESKELKNIYAQNFLRFWAAYPKKRSKGAAWKTWKKMNGARPGTDELVGAIERQKESREWAKESGKYIPYPATWLNARGWEDEIEEQSSSDDGPGWQPPIEDLIS